MTPPTDPMKLADELEERAAESRVAEMRRAAEIIAAEKYIGICEGGFPIASDRCEFCGSTWDDQCGRRASSLSRPIAASGKPQ